METATYREVSKSINKLYATNWEVVEDYWTDPETYKGIVRPKLSSPYAVKLRHSSTNDIAWIGDARLISVYQKSGELILRG